MRAVRARKSPGQAEVRERASKRDVVQKTPPLKRLVEGFLLLPACQLRCPPAPPRRSQELAGGGERRGPAHLTQKSTASPLGIASPPRNSARSGSGNGVPGSRKRLTIG